MPNVCAMPLINFPSFLRFQMARFSPKDSSLLFMLIYPFEQQIQSSQQSLF